MRVYACVCVCVCMLVFACVCVCMCLYESVCVCTRAPALFLVILFTNFGDSVLFMQLLLFLSPLLWCISCPSVAASLVSVVVDAFLYVCSTLFVYVFLSDEERGCALVEVWVSGTDLPSFERILWLFVRCLFLCILFWLFLCSSFLTLSLCILFWRRFG
jgi:hypothetical protein